MVAGRFEPIDLARATGALTQVPGRACWHANITTALETLPGGPAEFYGIPFRLASAGSAVRWAWIDGPASQIAIELGTCAANIVFAHFAIPDPASIEVNSPDLRPAGVVLNVGEMLASYALEYEDGTRHVADVRRRFEVNDLIVSWGQLAFMARPHGGVRSASSRGARGAEWGFSQTRVDVQRYALQHGQDSGSGIVGNYWVFALPNPRPDVRVSRVVLRGTGTGIVGIGGITIDQGPGNPLRYGAVETLLVEPPQACAGIKAEVRLGMIATVRPASASPGTGWGTPVRPESDKFLVDVAGADGAILSIDEEAFPLDELRAAGEAHGRRSDVKITWLPQPDAYLDVSLVDASTGNEVPARIRVATREGRYLPPEGHAALVDDRWFADTGADLQLGGTEYAYVPGRARVRVPTGHVTVEVVKGFEYRVLHRELEVRPGSSRTVLELQRSHDSKRLGWYSGDTHVHFLSPASAALQADAEMLDVVHLLAAQWGDLYTNIHDVGSVVRPDAAGRGPLVHVGSEHRQHLLGHLLSLGAHAPIQPLSTGGPDEGWIGDELRETLAGWADSVRKGGGLAVLPHFPFPLAEGVAGLLLGQIDAVEIRDFWWGADTYATREWYRLLNAGLRIPAVGGTDKMSAGMPVGGVRTYAQIRSAELTLHSWLSAIRHGRTVVSSGPFLSLSVDGLEVGDALRLVGDRGTVEVHAEAVSVAPLAGVEVIHNGHVVAVSSAVSIDDGGTFKATIRERLPVTPGWIAARCWSSSTAWHSWPVRFVAHTSPIYLDGTRPLVNPEDAAKLRGILDGTQAWLATLAPPGDVARDRLSRTLDAAQRRLSDLVAGPRQ